MGVGKVSRCPNKVRLEDRWDPLYSQRVRRELGVDTDVLENNHLTAHRLHSAKTNFYLLYFINIVLSIITFSKYNKLDSRMLKSATNVLKYVTMARNPPKDPLLVLLGATGTGKSQV